MAKFIVLGAIAGLVLSGSAADAQVITLTVDHAGYRDDGGGVEISGLSDSGATYVQAVVDGIAGPVNKVNAKKTFVLSFGIAPVSTCVATVRWGTNQTALSNERSLLLTLCGERGVAGAAGADRPEGLKGLKGDTGDPGPMGESGLKGDKGDQGDQGVSGTKSAGLPPEFQARLAAARVISKVCDPISGEGYTEPELTIYERTFGSPPIRESTTFSARGCDIAACYVGETTLLTVAYWRNHRSKINIDGSVDYDVEKSVIEYNVSHMEIEETTSIYTPNGNNYEGYVSNTITYEDGGEMFRYCEPK